jgi:hypothetical protein
MSRNATPATQKAPASIQTRPDNGVPPEWIARHKALQWSAEWFPRPQDGLHFKKRKERVEI